MAGITLSQMRQDMRALLLDGQVPYQWPDLALDQAIWEGIAVHSFMFPRQVRLRLDVLQGQSRFALFGPEETQFTLVPLGYNLDAGEVLAPGAAGSVMVLGVSRVELPVPTPIPFDGGQVTDPAGTGSDSYKQAWRWEGNVLTLRNPAQPPETGPGQMAVEIVQTYTKPDTADVGRWDGPFVDQSFVYLLAQRAAYQQLLGVQLRDGQTVKGLDVTRVLLSLEVEITRAMKTRGRRTLRSRTMDI